ncbi:MAG TPA: oleate hydratase, partial [Bacteroidia bacterium]|nr:oleate hydratase [Bacteroidia bacterium]
MKKNISIIGAGFSGLAAACYLAKDGYNVTIYEKHSQIGGRARTIEKDGFLFDMGPSWYWMPDVFERFFGDFGKKVSDYYELRRLSPGYRIYFNDEYLDVPASLEELYEVFEKHEKGSAAKLKQFLKEAEYKYNVGIHEL